MPESTASESTAWPAGRRITISDLQAATDRGERWSMLTSYDTLTPVPRSSSASRPPCR